MCFAVNKLVTQTFTPRQLTSSPCYIYSQDCWKL